MDEQLSHYESVLEQKAQELDGLQTEVCTG